MTEPKRKPTKRIFTMTEDEYTDLCEEQAGFCEACGEQTDSPVEPDARGYECSECGAMRVTGLEWLMVGGQVEFTSTPKDAI